MRPLIYIPQANLDKALQPADQLAAFGLGHLTGVNTGEGPGPDGGRGMFYGWQDATNLVIGFDDQHQTWLPSFRRGDADAGLYWTGFRTDSPPTESDLRRPDSRQGKFVELSNGDRYLITTPATLDRYPSRDDDGNLIWLVDESFNWLVQDLEKRKATGIIKTSDGETDRVSIIMDTENDFEFLVKLLQINYRLTEELICHLQILSEQFVRDLVIVLMGLTPLKEE